MTGSDNLLYEMAQALAAQDDHRTAIALRKLAQAGYASLEEVDGVPDWVLLAISGIGVRRLAAIRALTRAEWQPPSAQAIEIMQWFLSASRLARRFWPPETLLLLIDGDAIFPNDGESAEKRLALDMFSQAARRALSHCRAEELAQVLRSVGNGRCAGTASGRELSRSTQMQPEQEARQHADASGTTTSSTTSLPPGRAQDSNHYAYQVEKRRQIVKEYWTARRNREVKNSDEWARARHNICGKTLLSYVRQFPDLCEDS